VQNVGSGTVDITETYVDGGRVTAGGLGTATEGTTTPITFAGTFASGDKVHIKVVCEDGVYSEGTYKVETL